MNHRQQAILIGVYSDVEAFSQRPFSYGADCGFENATIRDARSGVVAIDAARWLGRPLTNSESTMNSTAYARLEEAGFIERIRNHGKTSALRITEAGRVAAGLLVGETGAGMRQLHATAVPRGGADSAAMEEPTAVLGKEKLPPYATPPEAEAERAAELGPTSNEGAADA